MSPDPLLLEGEIRAYRILGTVAVIFVLAMGVLHRVVNATTVDPLWERGLVVVVLLAAVTTSFFWKDAGFRRVVEGTCCLITAWIVHLLVLNDLSMEYGLSLFLVVAAVSVVIRKETSLRLYLGGVVVIAFLAITVADVSERAQVSPSLYLAELTIACVLLYIVASGNLRSQKALRRSERRARLLFENGTDAIFVHRPDGRILDANRRAAELAGKSRDGLIGASLSEMEAESGHGTAQLAWRDGGTEEPRTVESWFQRGTTTFPVEIRFARFPTQEGSDTLILSTVRDISEHKRLEAWVRQTQKLEAVGRLAGGIAHDFNNVLTVIRGQTTLLLADAPPDDVRADLEIIQEAAESAAELTRHLLAFSRDQKLEPEVVSARETLERTERLLARLLGEDIALKVTMKGVGGAIRVDPGKLEHSLINLAVNARDAMDGGGTFTLAAEEVILSERELAEVDLSPGRRRYLRILVSDTGTGIPSDVIPRVFEPFFSTKSPGRGSGLGLAMVYGFVRQSGGQIEIRSEEGRGTDVVLYLPLHPSSDGRNCSGG